MSSIKVAIVGVGSCAKSLVEGVQYYKETDDKVGLMYPDIGGYSATDVEFVVGFDVDRRKVNRPLAEALRASPNCSMDHVYKIEDVEHGGAVSVGAMVFNAPTLDGVADYMDSFPEKVSFRTGKDPILTFDECIAKVVESEAHIIVNYLPVGSEEASRYWIDVALAAGVHFVNCIPTMIDTEETQRIEQRFIDNNLTIIGSDMRSAWGASRMSEVLQGAMLDSGLMVTQHIQTNMAAGSTQGQEHIRSGRTANTDFLNMSEKYRLKNKHVSKENVLKGQNLVRGESTAGMTLFAGPSLTVQQKPGSEYIGTDNKIANFDIIAYGFAGSRYEMSARLSVQDSPNSGGVVISAIRFCIVAAEMGMVGYLRGPSAWTQKTPPLQLSSADAKFECDCLARRESTKITRQQYAKVMPIATELPYTFQSGESDYE